MDFIHRILNFVLPILTIFLFIFFFPAVILFRLLSFSVRSVFPEKLAGKVVLITGASSGIGEHLAYEYAKRGARLALVARREKVLETVAERARALGSPDVIAISADVSKVDDCKRFVERTIYHFGTLNHLVNNAGIATISPIQDQICASNYVSIMDTNFWGAVYTTQFALPHLQKSRGKIIVISSSGEWFSMPRLSIYNASKSALVSYFETLQIEVGSDVGVTIVTPGLVKSSITNDKWLLKIKVKGIPIQSTEMCAKGIVDGSSRGDKYLTEPAWMKVFYVWKMFCPEILTWSMRLMLSLPKMNKYVVNQQPTTSKVE